MKIPAGPLLFALATTILTPFAYGDETPPPSPRSYKGTAYEPGSSTVLYTEKYEVQLREAAPLLVKTEYRSASGELIAERSLDFSRHPYKPDYRLVDIRDGYEEGAEIRSVQDGKAEMRVFVRESRKKSLKDKIIRVPEPAVVDGGFNTFIKAHWNKLMGGKRVPFSFVAPNRLDYFAFEAVPEDSRDKDTRSFLIRPENKALRLLVDPIRVTYDVASRRMTEYRGLSNINNSEGKSFPIRLEYPALGP